MLITLVDTKSSESKFVLHKYPYQKISLQQTGVLKSSINDIQTVLNQQFDDFGIYRKKALIPTSNQPIPVNAILEIFIANQRNSQAVMGIDDDCVLVWQSVSMSHSNTPQMTESWSSQNATLTDLADQSQSIVNSISLIWKLDSFDGVQQAKHRLNYFLGVLQRKEQHNRYLTKEIKKVLEEKENIKNRIKDLIAINTKDKSQNYEEIRIKILIKQIEANAKRVRQKIGIFELLRQYYKSWVNGKQFQIRQDSGIWQGTIGKHMKISQVSENEIKQLQLKTLVMHPQQLSEMLPSAFYSQRAKRLYEKGFTFNHLSFKKLLQKNGQLNRNQLYHTAYFLIKNNLSIDIYPINHPFSYNLFYLKAIPTKNIIDKFHRIFPGKNFFEVINSYSTFKFVKEQQQTLKYLLLKRIVGQVKIHIYKKFEKQNQEGNDLMLEQLLNKYNMSENDLNYLLSVQPFAFSKESSLLNNIVKYIRQNSKQWGFYFIE